jgi:hypothetical protein
MVFLRKPDWVKIAYAAVSKFNGNGVPTLSKQRAASTGEVAMIMNTDTASALSILYGLRDEGIVDRDSNGMWWIG